jgi:hypothetical protein
MKRYSVPHCHVVTDFEGGFFASHMQHRVILNVGALPDPDSMHVASNHDLKPNAGMRTDLDVADHIGGRSNESSLMNLGPNSPPV